MSVDQKNKESQQESSNRVRIMDILPAHISSILLQWEKMRSVSEAQVDFKNVDSKSKIMIPVTPDNVKLDEVNVKIFADGVIDPVAHTSLMCETMEPVFGKYRIEDSDAVRLFVQAMVCVFGSKVVEEAGIAEELKQGGIDLKTNVFQKQQLYIGYNNSQSCKDTLKLHSVFNPNVVMLAYCGTLLLLAGQRLEESSVKDWTEKRVRELTASMMSVIDTKLIVSFNLITAQMINLKMKFHTGLRAKFIRVLFGICGSNSDRSSLARAMLNNLAWAEMNYVRMVQVYLLGRYPELLCMGHLRSTLGVLKEAWTYLGTLPEEERPFAKLLYNSQQTKSLQRKRFVLLIDAACAVRDHMSGTSSNHQGGSTSAAGAAIRKTVAEYLASLDHRPTGTSVPSGNIAIMDSPDAADAEALRLLERWAV